MNTYRQLRLLFAMFFVSATLSGFAHTTSVTAIEARLTTKFISLRVDLQQPDLLQIAQENLPAKRQYESIEEFLTNAPWVMDYVTNRLIISMDGKRAPGVVTNWPPKDQKLTIELRPDEFEAAIIPFHIYWPIPKGAKELNMTFNLYDTPGFSGLFQILFDLGEDAMPVMHVVPAGKETVIDLVAFAEDTDMPEATVPATNSVATNAVLTNGTSTNTIAEPALPEAPKIDRAKVEVGLLQFVRVGFDHILPKGLDHILFVLGLFLLSPKWKPLLLQVTAFTVAHSLTLSLAMLDLFTLSPKVVEPLIALSISAVALENLCRDEVSRWRWGGVFLFGLIHGLGFAGILSGMQIPEGKFVGALVCFNVGVEFGQLAVIGIAALLVWPIHQCKWYSASVRTPACWMLAAIGLYWAIERAFFGG
ncbi:MAG: hypothetical protein ACI91J_000586 [Yoonia sp.]|jgi:hypothetical protein